jgi:hypothetical protein
LASSPEQPPLASQVHWASLSERSQATVRQCWPGMLIGYTIPELAEAVGVTAPALADALEQLREELQA